MEAPGGCSRRVAPTVAADARGAGVQCGSGDALARRPEAPSLDGSSGMVPGDASTDGSGSGAGSCMCAPLPVPPVPVSDGAATARASAELAHRAAVALATRSAAAIPVVGGMGATRGGAVAPPPLAILLYSNCGGRALARRQGAATTASLERVGTAFPATRDALLLSLQLALQHLGCSRVNAVYQHRVPADNSCSTVAAQHQVPAGSRASGVQGRCEGAAAGWAPYTAAAADISGRNKAVRRGALFAAARACVCATAAFTRARCGGVS